MIDEKKEPVHSNKLKAYATNAVTEAYKVETEALLPIASDTSVEDARDWVNDESRL